MSRSEIANELKRLVARYWCKKRYGVNFELGLNKRGRLRADVFAMNLKGHTIITEVKSCMADFRSDFKWQLYRKYARKLYLAMTESLWADLQSSIPKGIGVMTIQYNSRNVGSMKVVQRASNQDPDPSTHQSLILRAAYRGSKFRNVKQLSVKEFYSEGRT